MYLSNVVSSPRELGPREFPIRVSLKTLCMNEVSFPFGLDLWKEVHSFEHPVF
jgi:hypothetical protein